MRTIRMENRAATGTRLVTIDPIHGFKVDRVTGKSPVSYVLGVTYHNVLKAYVVEEEYTYKKPLSHWGSYGGSPFFADTIEKCIRWIENTYNIRIKLIDPIIKRNPSHRLHRLEHNPDTYVHVDIQRYIIGGVEHFRARVQGKDWRFETRPGETIDQFRKRIMDTLDSGIVTHFIGDWDVTGNPKFSMEIFTMAKGKLTTFQYHNKKMFDIMLKRIRQWEREGKDIHIIDVRPSVYETKHNPGRNPALGLWAIVSGIALVGYGIYDNVKK